MSHLVRSLFLLALPALTWMPTAPAQAAPEDRRRVTEAVVQLQARDCQDGKDKVASGFLWRSSGQVVTALHAVAGCSAITAISEHAGDVRIATLAKVLRSADLVLLALDRPFDIEPVAPSDRPTRTGDALRALGYTYDAPTLTDRELKIAEGQTRLRDMLPSSVADEIRQAGAPDLELTILRLNGTLVPGFSGAPIIDGENRVVGIGNGGIEGGAAAISWGIPIAYATTLESSTEPVQVDFTQTSSLFGADLPRVSSREILCGDLSFKLMRTRPFERLIETTDDPVAMQQVIAYLQIPPASLAGFAFDIWVEEASGATIALPKGAGPIEADGYCAVVNDAGLEVMMTGNRIFGPADAQARSVAFEMAISAQFPSLYWQVDPAWTYPFPHVNGKDGMAVRRKSFLGISQFHGQPVAYATSALVSRGQAFIGIAVVDPDIDYGLVEMCQYDPTQYPCEELRVQAMHWAPFALGTLLTTFPPS